MKEIMVVVLFVITLVLAFKLVLKFKSLMDDENIDNGKKTSLKKMFNLMAIVMNLTAITAYLLGSL